MTKKLLPCPFCASHDVELRESITDAYVACNNCGCRTGFVFLGASDPSKANKLIEVAEVWNARPEPVAAEPVAYEPSGPTKRMAEILGTDFVLNAPKQAQPIDDEALVEKLARALAIADGIEICSDASYRHSSYGIRARAILPIIRDCRHRGRAEYRQTGGGAGLDN